MDAEEAEKAAAERMAIEHMAAERMVREQIEKRGIFEPRLLEALRQTPRHWFVPIEEREYAYDDTALAIGVGQTISQPYMVAVMTDLLNLQGDETVLEIGTGSGYQAAVLAKMARLVHSMERHASLANQAVKTLRELGIENVQVHVGDGSLGWSEGGPYAGIVVTAAAPGVPQDLLEQLAPEGRLVIPVGGRTGQVLQVWMRSGDEFVQKTLFKVAFVPLRGKAGWEEATWDGKVDWA
jgi:protein-L-isoaspartate(D-aspartate) O-methyltransferase